MKNIFGLTILSICFLLSACTGDEDFTPSFLEGLKPVYANGLDWKEVTIEDPRPVGKLGKIYYKDGLIYVNEINKGIHIVDNSDSTNPIVIKFISISGSKDISIKGNFLYTDNVTDLLVLDISDIENITVLNRIPNIYPSANQNAPEFESGYFECVDSNLGTVIGWEVAIINNPQCRNF